ncbi:hypothetical protein QWZ08_23895 [Ferruginibacter paludis]|jgi:hypothetical protein|uniref:hypothetical protein n=1 Tax=Ferruginibacter paludis TaxID=1310417 RepID=UPI0025B3A06F|nr:hypothetical protein [Ferruginibacter paludis]MDN3658706.1 hypothetical protein [Ferruginibacter paludis]
MKTFTKKLLTIALLFGIAQVAMADRGVGKKKNKTILNIYTPSTLRNSIAFNLKSGLSYKGSLLTNTQTVGNSIMANSLITYQKGNITYVIPYKHKIVMPEITQGYTGMKLIIHSH